MENLRLMNKVKFRVTLAIVSKLHLLNNSGSLMSFTTSSFKFGIVVILAYLSLIGHAAICFLDFWTINMIF